MIPHHISHQGATQGVTGSCHQLTLEDGRSILVDCGLFQGAEVSADGSATDQLAIRFPLTGIAALVVTHVHIDHVGRIPYLMAAGYSGPILCSQASAHLLPLVLEDAIKVGATRDERLISAVLAALRKQLVPLPYGQWHRVLDGDTQLKVKLQPAGHILGSAYAQVLLRQGKNDTRILFSGDLGAPHTPLLPAPRSPYRADVLVLEATYGDRLHHGRTARVRQLQAVIEHAMRDRGCVLIPAFSIGRTQELVYEIEQIIHHQGQREAAPGIRWNELDIIIDSPLAARFTHSYRQLKTYWDKEAKRRLKAGRHPLAFSQLLTIDSHKEHQQTLDYLAKGRRPAVVIAASGMCSGGRIVNYLKAMLGDPRHDILFVGYQAQGTPGRAIQQYGPKGGYVELDGSRYHIRAAVHTLSGYSAHADQADLIRFIARMRHRPQRVILVHGDRDAKQGLAAAIDERFGQEGMEVTIP